MRPGNAAALPALAAAALPALAAGLLAEAPDPVLGMIAEHAVLIPVFYTADCEGGCDNECNASLDLHDRICLT